MDDTRLFYDDLARDYHLVYPDWEVEVDQQARVLDRVLRARCGDRTLAVLDCTCGIGTQALGLARLGHAVVGTDLSSGAIERAREVAARRGSAARFQACDIRHVHREVEDQFDVVLTCHNSLPHLLSTQNLRQAVDSMNAKLRRGGLLLLGVSDYDALIANRPTGTLPKIRGEGEHRRIVFQVWTWHADGLTYDLEHFLGHEGRETWTFQVRRVRCRAITRTELLGVVAAAGLAGGEWLEPGATGCFEPLCVAVKP